jgi:hypothetical protein
MTRNRIIFYSIFGAYQLLAFVFTIVMENSASFLFKLVGYVGWFKYITLLGFLLIVTDFIWMWMDSRRLKKLEDAYRHENNILKAKVYDMQEGIKAKEELPKANKSN